MSSARHDYQQFLAWLHVPERGATEDTRRFANLVDQNFDAVAANSRALSRRSVLLAAKARESLLQTDFTPPVVAGAVSVGEWAWSALHSLTVGPFRGFRVAETFNFPQRITMFYGPNGSGKTSLCEALELALLGSVDEASAKRISPQRYFANLHENRYEAPALAARGAEGQVSAVQADSEAYRFCFVEKNRIDNFSRIAAKSAGEKKDLIAALFGMEQFHDFVTNFNESMDQQLNLVAIQQQELETQRATLQRDQATINGEFQAFQSIAQEEAAYAGAYAADLSYQQLLELIGSDAAPGRLHHLNAQLDGPTPGLYGVSSQALVAAYQAADLEQARLEDVDKRLTAKTGETSFQNLYNAVLGLQALSPDNCPACGTPINGKYHVVRDPYVQARDGLAQLQELANLQTEKNAVRAEWERASRGLEGLLTAFGQRIGAQPDHADDRVRYLASPGADHRAAWWKASYEIQDDAPSMAQRIVDFAAECERIRAAPETRVDALHVLSEGHVRCLGVAILLAKALHIQAPTIIFDDAINAIDTEHREGIREAIFQSDRFAATQIIVTCHSSEFIKDLQNHVEKGQWTAYYFMPHVGDHRPRVKGNEITFNYLEQARAALDIGDWRNALGASRQALEMLTDKIWKWLGKNDLGVITLPLAGRGAEPNLRNLCEALKKRLDDARTFVHQDKPAVVQGLADVIGVPVQSNVWTYLNKGVHEEADRDDYDPNLVRTIVENLERMNQLRLGSMPVDIAGVAQAAVAIAVAQAADPR